MGHWDWKIIFIGLNIYHYQKCHIGGMSANSLMYFNIGSTVAVVICGIPSMDVLARSQSMLLTTEEEQEVKSYFPACFKHCQSLVISGKICCDLLVSPYQTIVTDGTQPAASISHALTILEKGIKAGREFIGTDDPLQAAVTVLGKNVVGSFLSKLATCQCAGLIGFIVNTLAPEVSIKDFNYFFHATL